VSTAQGGVWWDTGCLLCLVVSLAVLAHWMHPLHDCRESQGVAAAQRKPLAPHAPCWLAWGVTDVAWTMQKCVLFALCSLLLQAHRVH
jgi:hypothetical protein